MLPTPAEPPRARTVPPLSPELRASLGPPPLYKGEDEAEYAHVYERLRTDVVPRDVVEEIYIRDAANYWWDVRRLRRNKAKLLESSRAAGLWRLLKDLIPEPQARIKLLHNWARGDAQARDEVTTLLRTAGIDDSAVEAQTLCALIDQVERIDRLIMLADARFVALLREIDRHRSSLGARLRDAMPPAIDDAEFEEVTAAPGEEGT